MRNQDYESDDLPGGPRTFIPRWRAGPAACLDFAVTSGLRPEVIAESATTADAACTRYEDFKVTYKNTAHECQSQGLTFIPVIVEAVGGGWGKEARKIWSELAKSSASAAGEFTTESSAAVALLQRLAITLHRENARAVLRRLGNGGQALPPGQDLSVLVTAAESN